MYYFVTLLSNALVFPLCLGLSMSESDNQKTEQLASCLKLASGGSELIVSHSNSTEYQNLNYQWNTRSPQLHPIAYILPQNSKDVQIAIKCGQKLNISMVAKSGGHSYEKYSFRGQVVIDLQKLNSVVIDVQTSKATATAKVGAGILMGRLYWELWNSTKGRFGIPGTSCPTAGIGGVTLGGGFGIWSKRWGLTADNVLEFEFVDAQGQILIVNEKSNYSDLFWALRGSGGGNYGIVTNFKFKLQNVSSLLVTKYVLHYAPIMFTSVFKSWQMFNYKIKDTEIFTMLKVKPDRITVLIIDADLNVSSVRKDFPAVKFGNNATILTDMKFIELVDEIPINLATMIPADLATVRREDYPKQSYRAKSYYCSKILNETEIEILAAILTQVPEGITVHLASYGGMINKVERDATAFVHRNSLYCVQIGIRSQNPSSEEWVRRLDTAVKKTLDNGESYQNYIDAELVNNSEYLKRYYGSNLARVVKIKNKYDPDNYFRFDQSIPLNLVV